MATTTSTEEEASTPPAQNFQDFLDDLQERIADRRREVRDNIRQSRLYKDWEKRRLEFEEQLDERVSKLLHRVGVPTREEVRNLEKKISRLDREYQQWRKVQSAKATKAKAAPQAPPPTPAGSV